MCSQCQSVDAIRKSPSHQGLVFIFGIVDVETF